MSAGQGLLSWLEVRWLLTEDMGEVQVTVDSRHASGELVASIVNSVSGFQAPLSPSLSPSQSASSGSLGVL